MYIALLLLLISLVNCQWKFGLYKDHLSKIIFPKYTPDMRLNVAKQVDSMLSVYVNKESKAINYQVDHSSEMRRILKNAESMSDKEFHLSISKMVLSFRDLHTNYYLPGPYGCYRALLPLDFDLLESSDLINDPKVVVKSFSVYEEVLSKSPSIEDLVQIGDELITFNGKTFKTLFSEKKNITGGANDYGGMRSLITYLSYVNGRMFPLPTESSIEYHLKRNESYSYKYTANYVARINTECIASSLLPDKSGAFASNEDQDDS